MSRLFIFMSSFLLVSLNVSHAHETGTFITSCAELQQIASQGEYYLDRDLDCADLIFNPIGDAFSGTLDGNNHTISNLTIQNPDGSKAEDTGLFRALIPSSTSSPVIQNLNFSNVLLRGQDNRGRGVVAAYSEGATIANVTVSALKIEARGDHDDTGRTGGIVAIANNTTLENVHVKDAEINKNAYAGGLIGQAINTTVKKSSVTGLSTTGVQCMDGTIFSPCGFGGLIGFVDSHDAFEDSHTEIDESFASGKITVTKRIGGLVGVVEAWAALTVKNSYAIVALVPDCGKYTCKYAGGLIGRAVERNYLNDLPITLEYVYTAGLVKPNAEDEGRAVVGHDVKKGSYRVKGSNSYFDTDVVKKNNSGDGISAGLTTTQMQDADNAHFEEWDRDTWEFIDGKHPVLK